jgi:hypothetical protein
MMYLQVFKGRRFNTCSNNMFIDTYPDDFYLELLGVKH